MADFPTAISPGERGKTCYLTITLSGKVITTEPRKIPCSRDIPVNLWSYRAIRSTKREEKKHKNTHTHTHKNKKKKRKLYLGLYFFIFIYVFKTLDS